MLAVTWFAVILLPLRGGADDRLTGYWIPAPGATDPAVFSIAQLGKWNLVTERWAGDQPASPELKVRYLATADGARGTLSADQNLDKLPEAPRTIAYLFEPGRLTLTIEGPAHAGTYELVKGTPPAAPATMRMPPMPRAETVAPKKATAPVFPWERLFGDWATEPQATVQVSLFVNRSKEGSSNINQMWVKGSDSPSVSKGGNYVGSTVAGHGVLTKKKPDYEGSLIPLVLNLAFEGEALIVTVDEGVYAGQHRLVRKVK